MVDEKSRSYTCTTGHAIPAADLGRLTELQSLDKGAEVRVCSEHGAPIVVSIMPEAHVAQGEEDMRAGVG